MRTFYSGAAKLLLASMIAAASLPAVQLAVHAAEADYIQGKELQDGVYPIAFKTWKINEDTVSGMDSRFAKIAELFVQDGSMSVQMTINSQNNLIENLQVRKGTQLIDVETVAGTKETEERVIRFPVEDLQDMVHAHVHVNILGTIVEQDFRIQLITPEHSLTEIIPVVIYAGTAAEISPVQKLFAKTAEVTKTAAAMTVSLTALDSAAIQSVLIDDKKVLPAGGQTYTFEVQVPKKLIHAEVTAMQAGSPMKFPVRLQLAVKGAELVISNPFADIDADENKDAILHLLALGIIKNAGTFKPHETITRGQFALMIARTLNLPAAEDAGFADVRQLKDRERTDAINALAKAGIIKKSAYFRPNEALTRQQSALIIYRTISYANTKELQFGSTLIYADQHRITDEEAREAFALLYAGGMMTGSQTSSGTIIIEPNKEMKRTHTAKALNGALKYIR